jgi:hypothetical protein
MFKCSSTIKKRPSEYDRNDIMFDDEDQGTAKFKSTLELREMHSVDAKSISRNKYSNNTINQSSILDKTIAPPINILSP